MRQSLSCRALLHALMSLFIIAGYTSAATLVWDPGVATGAQDGAGTWSTTSTTWWNADNASNVVATASDQLIFGAGTGAGTAGSVTISGTVTSTSITFNAPGAGAYTLTAGTLAFGGGTITSNVNATLATTMTGSTGWTKTGTGTLSLTGSATNSITGALNVQGGILALNKAGTSDSQLPVAIANNVTVNIGSGSAQAILRLDRVNQIGDIGTVLNFAGTGGQAGILRMNGFSDTVGTIRSTAGAGIIENGHASNVATVTVGNVSADTFSGIIQNGAAAALNFSKTNAGVLSLTGVNTYTGTTSVRNGVLALTDTGSIANSTDLALFQGGTLRLNNTTAANNNNRLGDTATLSLMGGSLAFADDASATAFAETIGAARVIAGASNLSTASTGTGSTTLTLASLTRSEGATLNFIGTSLGTSAQNQILVSSGFANEAGIMGGWATVGNEFAKYGANGVTALLAADYELGGESAWAFESNAKFTSAVSLGADRHVNSLNLAAAGATTLGLGGHTLRVESGGILVSGSAATTISGGTLTGGVGAGNMGEIIIHQNSSAALEISAVIADNGTHAVSLVKSGSGTLRLTGSNTFTGNVYLNAGTLQLGNAAALANAGKLAVEGGILDLNGNNVTVGALSSQSLNTTGLITNTVAGAKTLTVGNDNGSSSFSGQLGVNLNFTKTGTGVMTFNQSNANYAGIITVAQGTLVTGNPTSLGTTVGATDKTVIMDGATLDISGGFARNERLEIAGHGVNGQGALTNNGESQNIQFGTLTGHTTFNVPIRYDFDNQLTGNNFNLTKIGVGELALEGSLVQGIGDIHIKQGTITWSGTADLGLDSSTLFVDAGAIAQYYNKANDLKRIVLSGGMLRRSGTATGSVGFALEAQGGLVLLAGASSIVHSNSNLTFKLNTINRSLGATLNFDIGTSTGLATIDTQNTNGIIGGYATVGNNTWAVSGTAASANPVTGLSSYNTNNFSAVANNVDVNGAQSPTTFAVNTLRFNTAGAAVLTLTGTNTISSGGLLVTSTVGNNLTRITGGSMQGAANGDLVIIQNNGSNGLTIESTIINNGTSTALTKAGAGTLTLSGNNLYTGGTFFSGGVVAITKLSDTGDSNLGNSTGGSDNALTFNTGRLQYANAATADGSTARDILLMSGGGIIDVANAARTLTLNGVISNEALITGEGTYVGSSVLTKEGAGTLVLGGSTANTSTGVTTINAGTVRLNKVPGVDAIAGNVTVGNNTGGLDILVLAASNQIRDTSIITLNGTGANAGIFRLAGNSETIGGLTSTAAGTGIVENESGTANIGVLAVSVAAGSSYTFSGIMRNGDGTGTDGTLAFTKSGSGTQILTGTNTYTGDTTVSGGLLTLGNGGTAGSIAGASRIVLSEGSFSINRSNAYAVTNVVTGLGSFIQEGSGTTTLSNNNNDYSGSTVVQSGVLMVTNTSGSATGTSNVFVNGGTLAGTGIIAGTTTITGAGQLAPGDTSVANGIGTLRFGSDLLLQRQAGGKASLTLQLGTINDVVHNDAAGISANAGNLAAYLTSQLGAYEAEVGIHDRLVVDGALRLEAGTTILVDNTLGYAPKFGDVFDLFDWGNLDVGVNAVDRSWSAATDLQLPTLAGGLSYDFSLFTGAGIIVVVPEPSRVLLLLLAGGFALMRRRRNVR